MTSQELEKKTVLQLRKIAKVNSVTLGAGVSKDDIVEKIKAAMEKKGGLDAIIDPFAEKNQEKPAALKTAMQQMSFAGETAGVVRQQPAVPARTVASAPQVTSSQVTSSQVTSAQAAPSQVTVSQGQPQYRAAWHNPTPRPAMRPQYPQQQRPVPQQPMQTMPQRTPTYQDSVRPAAAQRQPSIAPHRFGPDADRTSADDMRSRRTAYDSGERAPSYMRENTGDDYSVENSMPTVSEIISAGDCVDVGGFLEMEPDRTGYIRTGTAAKPSADDAFVSAAQVSRYNLKNGDFILGKTSSQRISGKIHPLLFITEINGAKAEEKASRSDFSSMTAAYPVRNYDLSVPDDYPMGGLIEKMNPFGAGQRSVVFTPAGEEYGTLLKNFARVVAERNPEAAVIYLMFNGRDEDAALLASRPGFTVFSASFEKNQQEQLHMAEMALEHAKRLTESRRDVLLAVEDFTALASFGEKGVQTAREIFSSARRTGEGGTLAVAGIMERDCPESKAFRRAANHVLDVADNSGETAPACVRTMLG